MLIAVVQHSEHKMWKKQNTTKEYHLEGNDGEDNEGGDDENTYRYWSSNSWAGKLWKVISGERKKSWKIMAPMMKSPEW